VSGVRLWSLHPRYLDARGLVALWREGLLARAVLAGTTKGYRHHPQLERFRATRDPVACVDAYLHVVLVESRARGYEFDATKIGPRRGSFTVPATSGQLAYEWTHLLSKLRRRDRERWLRLRTERPRAHPMVKVSVGEVATWERVRAARRRR
jgi:hypothetical protein